MMLTRVQINDHTVRWVEAKNLSRAPLTGTGDHDAVYTYQWRVLKSHPEDNFAHPSSSAIAEGTLTHRYGDGVLVLLNKILTSFNHICGPDIPKRTP